MIELTDEGRAIMESSISRWRRVRLAQSISHLPLVALTSVPGPHVLTGAGVDCGGGAATGGGDGPAPQLTFTSATAASPSQLKPFVYSKANDCD